MTFLEAAIEVLKQEGKPLHVKDLTKIALKHDLLSVIGREPELAMQARLQEEAKRPTSELLRISPGVFGLRSFPPRPEPAEGPGTPSPRREAPPREAQSVPAKKEIHITTEEAVPGSPGMEAGRRPRGRPRRGGEAPAAPAIHETAGAEDQQQRRGRGRRMPLRGPDLGNESREGPQQALQIAAEPPIRQNPASHETSRGGSPSAPPRRAHSPLGMPSGRLTGLSPSGNIDPNRKSTSLGSVLSPVALTPIESLHQPGAATPQPASDKNENNGNSDKSEPAREPQARYLTLTDAAVDVLRGSSDGRPVHFRQIVDIALKRKILRGDAADLWRALRAAVIRDQRQRDTDGLRSRVKNLGQGQYALNDRKLEPDLQNAERELLDRLNRTREATRVALRRRVKVLPPSAFELLMRLLLERMGMISAELIKRGDAVAYYAGSVTRGARVIKTLAAVRPGEGELTREAVGELRAGLKLRGFEEGLLLCAGRASSAALAEMNAGPGIELYDQDPLTDLLIRHQIGVRRMSLPIEYLDLDLFAELLEPA